MRYFAAVSAFFLGCLVGWFCAQKIKIRLKVLSKLCIMCDIMAKKVEFSHEKVRDLLKAAHGESYALGAILSACADRLGEGESACRCEVARCARTYLNAEESEEVAEFLCSLGTANTALQVKSLRAHGAILERLRAAAEQDVRKEAKLRLQLGALIGAGLAILIV